MRPSRSVLLVWGPAHKGPRSAVLGRALGVPVVFLSESWRRGLGDPLKYPRLVLRTLLVLVRDRPRVVIVQSPPSLAVWVTAVYAWLRGGAFLIDAHSDAFQRARWTRPAWLNRIVARRALITLVTDKYWRDLVRSWGANAMVVPDIPLAADSVERAVELERHVFHLLVVNTWADDEPLASVLNAVAELPEVRIHVTGAADDRVAALGEIPPNVRFTGFLPMHEYRRLMRAAHAVVCLTDRDHTMQRGACEAMSLDRPILTSDWPLLRAYFDRGAVHVDNSAQGIRDGIRRLMTEYDSHLAEIAELRQVRSREWAARREALMNLIERAASATRR